MQLGVSECVVAKDGARQAIANKQKNVTDCLFSRGSSPFVRPMLARADVAATERVAKVSQKKKGKIDKKTYIVQGFCGRSAAV